MAMASGMTDLTGNPCKCLESRVKAAKAAKRHSRETQRKFQKLHPDSVSGSSHSFGKSENNLLKGLHQLLQRLDNELRHRVLSQRFTESQRQELERWMLARPQSSTIQRRTTATNMSKKSSKAPKASLAEAFRRKAGISHLHGLVVHARLQSVRYSAVVTIEGLRLLTKEHHSLKVVKGFRSALVDMKRRMEGVGHAGFEARFREVLGQCLAEHKLQPRAMGLRFCVILASLWLPRPLATPPFLAEGEALEAGLGAWRRLSEARGPVLRRGSVLQVQSPEEIAATWARVRSAYLEAVEEATSSAGCHKKRKSSQAAARLEVFEAAQAGEREKQLERWNRRQMAQEEALQRRRWTSQGACAYSEILKRVDQLLLMWSKIGRRCDKM